MAPITLTRKQFLAKKPGGDYGSYLSYVNARRTAKLGAAQTDPLGQTSMADIGRTVDSVYGPALTDQRITGVAHGMIDPVVAALTSDINTRAKQASDAIGANAAGVAGELGKIDYAAPYRTAKTEQAAVDEALQGRSDAYRTLDTAVLETLIFKGPLEMTEEDVAAKRGIDYSKSFSDARERVESGEADAAFFMRATPVEQVQAVAEAGESMPPKSTYFFPKIPTGLVFSPLE